MVSTLPFKTMQHIMVYHKYSQSVVRRPCADGIVEDLVGIIPPHMVKNEGNIFEEVGAAVHFDSTLRIPVQHASKVNPIA